MNDDVIRLSDLVPEYARHNKVTLQSAAFAMRELFIELESHHHSEHPYKAIPDQIIWVGKVGSSARSPKAYKLYFSVLSEYFNDLVNPNCNSESIFVRCLYTGEHSDNKDITPSMVYLSKHLFGQLTYETTNERLEFLSNEDPKKYPHKPNKEEIKTFRGKELVSVQGLAQGLIDMIIEVDRAHRGESKKLDPEAILTAAHKLGQKSSSTSWYEALSDLAKASEIEDFRSNRNTLEKYVGERK